jgi:hypothetical protein
MRTSLLGVFPLGRNSGYASSRTASDPSFWPSWGKATGVTGFLHIAQSELMLKSQREANAIFLAKSETSVPMATAMIIPRIHLRKIEDMKSGKNVVVQFPLDFFYLVVASI